MSIAEIIQSIKQNGVSWLLIVTIITTFIQIAPIKINPWDNILNWLGRGFTRGVNDKLDKVNDEITELKDNVEKMQIKQNEHIAKDEEDKIIASRGKIVSYAKRLIRKNDIYTLEELAYMVSLTDTYEEYCIKHPDFKNSVAVESINVIREKYAEKLREGVTNA